VRRDTAADRAEEKADDGAVAAGPDHEEVGALRAG
jgi:hypothetical protein